MSIKTVNERFKELRIKLELNQKDFAQKLGTTQAIISYIETGGKPSYDVMEGIFTGVENINFAWLVSGLGDMFTTDKGRGFVEELEGKIKVFEEETKNLKRREEIYLTTIESLSKR
jgi:transcriptional regulator with XRE-family HTH domain